MELSKIINYLNTIFDMNTPLEKYGTNGLQVEGKKEVNKISFAVDTCQDVIDKTVESNSDLLITHHGLFWPKLSGIVGNNKKRIQTLLKNDISLIGIHIPLDIHNEIGNNIGIIKHINANLIDGEDFPFIAEFDNPKTIDEVKSLIDNSLNTESKVFNFRKQVIKRIAVCSGGGTSMIFTDRAKSCDLLITGEMNLPAYHEAKEANIDLISAGHYSTETVGIKALMNKMKQDLDIECEFIENKVNL